MDIHLTARHLKITPAIKGYVTEKIEKAQKYFDHIVWAQVVLFIEKRTHKCEIVIHAQRQTFRALANASDLYSAVDLASDKIDRQLKKLKERLKDHKKSREKQAVLAEDGPTVPPPPAPAFSVIRQQVAPMAPAQAVEEMESLGQVFRLYHDKESGQIQVVYRRSDESYGILQPVKKSK
jgi:putative sigma-54 modulation protein